jgi:hypothetical protein
MKDKIKLGYALEQDRYRAGQEINIQPSHLLVTGLSQKAGKTTTLESLIKRSGKRAVVFRTKIGEKSFLSGTIIPPYFKDRSDWKFIKGLIESTMKMKIDKFEQATIINLCKQTGGNSLTDFKKKIDQKLGEKISNSTMVTLTNLQAYLDEVLPKLNTIQFSKELELVDGLNIIDLERFARDGEVQGLIIASVLEEILYNNKFNGTIVVMPEAWKFIPQERGNPCKIIVEEFIRQGATNDKYLWIDSQDMAGVDKTPLKQITEWILGYQSEKNEVKHTLEQIPLPKIHKPKEDDIMTLGKGVFYFASRDMTCKVYVQPFWLDDERAIKIATGQIKIEDLDVKIDYARNEVKPFVAPKPLEAKHDSSKEELNEMRIDFFSKLADMQTQVSIISQNLHELQNRQTMIDESGIVAKVLQKIPIQPLAAQTSINEEQIIEKVLARVPKGGNVVYTVSPLEKIRKDFIIDAKNKILDDVSKLSQKAKQMLKYLETRQAGVPTNELCIKCFLMKDGGGGYAKQVKDYGSELISINLAQRQTNGNFKGMLKERIDELIRVHGATEQEINLLYDHILYEILTSESQRNLTLGEQK